MHFEYIHAEYLQKRKNRLQWIRKTVVAVFITAQVLVVSGLLYLSFTE